MSWARPRAAAQTGVCIEAARQEAVLYLMAGLGPLLWFCHAALVWLKPV